MTLLLASAAPAGQVILAADAIDTSKPKALLMGLLGCAFLWLAFKVATNKNSGNMKENVGSLFTAICAVIIASIGVGIVTIAAGGADLLRSLGINI